MAAKSSTTSISAKISKKRKHPEDLPVSVSAKKSSIQLQREKLQALVNSNVEKGIVAPSMQMPPNKKPKLESGPRTSELSSTSNATKVSNVVHSDLKLLKQLVYEPAGLKFSSMPTKDSECEEYAGCSFSLNGRNVKLRVAKTTPTKNGQFVTFWKRIGKGPIMPFDAKDPIDLFVVCVQQKERFGQFVFPKTCFLAEKVLSTNGKGGKRAIRVYAPWVKTESKQAASTQSWQSKYFIDLSGGKADLQRIKLLYSK